MEIQYAYLQHHLNHRHATSWLWFISNQALTERVQSGGQDHRNKGRVDVKRLVCMSPEACLYVANEKCLRK